VSCQEGFIGLGSNLGEPISQISLALRQLNERTVLVKQVSSLYRTEPVDAPAEAWFTNAVARVASSLDPPELLTICHEIEMLQGRERNEYHGPRTIDLDLLMAGDAPVEDSALILPHPRLHLRRFVLVPLVEIAPEWKHPLLGLTARELLERCGDESSVVRIAPPPET
jgi:2-amino-4-hydroxy-6-hydroxymethyldihydropteridine diphosphokinase